MSFSNDVRQEILTSLSDKDKRFACLYGMLLFCRTVSDTQICFQSEKSIVAEAFEKLMKVVFKDSVKVNKSSSTRKNGSTLYVFEIDDRESIGRILNKYKIDPKERRINSELIVNNSLGVFAAGIFLACGSISDPHKEYHLEFSVTEQSLAEELTKLLSTIEVSAKTVVRRGQFVVYIKESESIEDVITFIGAPMCTLELMDIKVVKSVRNKVNRIVNCDSANLNKVIDAAIRQTEDIRLIDRTIGLENLSDELREVAELRINNADMSLQEIGESLEKPISRSGVNHRFRKIAKIAGELRCEGVKKNES